MNINLARQLLSLKQNIIDNFARDITIESGDGNAFVIEMPYYDFGLSKIEIVVTKKEDDTFNISDECSTLDNLKILPLELNQEIENIMRRILSSSLSSFDNNEIYIDNVSVDDLPESINQFSMAISYISNIIPLIKKN